MGVRDARLQGAYVWRGSRGSPRGLFVLALLEGIRVGVTWETSYIKEAMCVAQAWNVDLSSFPSGRHKLGRVRAPFKSEAVQLIDLKKSPRSK